MATKLSPAQERMAKLLGPLEGAEVPGGCESCNAFQTVEPIERGMWMITVHHDPGCAVLARKAKP